MDPNIKQSIVDRLKQTNNVLVTVKSSPSVDQLAACIGLTLFLNKQGKHATAVFSGEVPSTIEFLKPEDTLEKDTNSLRDFIISLDKSKADKLRYKVEDKVVKIFITPYRTSLSQDDLDFSQGDFNVDVVIALGVHAREELDQAIVAHGRILHDATVISVNTGKSADLGALNWSDADSSSLCEMVAGLVESMQANAIDSQMATAFLTGIVAETERFSNTKTSSTTMSVSAKLMAAGANQQLVATKLQEQAPQAAAPAEKAAGDGTLEIEHSQKGGASAELPEPMDDSTIVIDDEGNLKSGLQDEKPAESKEKPGRLTLEPPTLGGKLTANTEPDHGMGPAIDPLSAVKKDDQILEHKKPGGLSTASTPGPTDNPAQKEVKPTDTLSAIEQQVDSPHVAAPNSLNDLLAQNSSDDAVSTMQVPEPPTPVSSSQSAPALNDLLGQSSSNDDIVAPPVAEGVSDPMPPAEGIDDARKAVEAAAQASIADAQAPIAALNAQPLGGQLNPQPPAPADIPLPGPAADSMPPAQNPLGLPPNLVPPDPGLPPQQTGTDQPPTAPPPVPPPMMPPGM